MAPHLRVVADWDEPVQARPAPTVRVRLLDLLPVIALAQRKNFAWLKDFLDDEIRITSDLYEVVLAFQSCRPSA